MACLSRLRHIPGARAEGHEVPVLAVGVSCQIEEKGETGWVTRILCTDLEADSLRTKSRAGGGVMSAAEGIRELKLGTGLVPDLSKPLRAARSQRSLVHAPSVGTTARPEERAAVAMALSVFTSTTM